MVSCEKGRAGFLILFVQSWPGTSNVADAPVGGSVTSVGGRVVIPGSVGQFDHHSRACRVFRLYRELVSAGYVYICVERYASKPRSGVKIFSTTSARRSSSAMPGLDILSETFPTRYIQSPVEAFTNNSLIGVNLFNHTQVVIEIYPRLPGRSNIPSMSVSPNYALPTATH